VKVFPFLASLALAATDPSPILPSGTYNYVIWVDGKPSGKSSIRIARAGGVLTVTESATLPDDTIDTVRTLDPATFSTLTYTSTSAGASDTIDIHGKSATWKSPLQTKNADQAIDGPSMVFDFLAGEYAAVPAMANATRAKAFNVYCICFTGFDVKVSTSVPATGSRPDGVSPSDAHIAFTLDDGVMTFWYDPVTFVLHELDVPKAHFRIVLQTP
jgi:hypothetical protein